MAESFEKRLINIFIKKASITEWKNDGTILLSGKEDILQCPKDKLKKTLKISDRTYAMFRSPSVFWLSLKAVSLLANSFCWIITTR